MEFQKEVFKFQLKLAMKMNIPLVLHIREAEQEAYEVMREVELPSHHPIHRLEIPSKHHQFYNLFPHLGIASTTPGPFVKPG